MFPSVAGSVPIVTTVALLNLQKRLLVAHLECLAHGSKYICYLEYTSPAREVANYISFFRFLYIYFVGWFLYFFWSGVRVCVLVCWRTGGGEWAEERF